MVSGLEWIWKRSLSSGGLKVTTDLLSPGCLLGTFFTRCKWYLAPCSALPGQHGGTWHKSYHLSPLFINNKLGKGHQHSTYTLYHTAFRMWCKTDSEHSHIKGNNKAVHLLASQPVVNMSTWLPEAYYTVYSIHLFVRGKAHNRDECDVSESDLAKRVIFTLQIDVVH